MCANPDCEMPFDYGQGRFFRFHKSHSAGEQAPNTHSETMRWVLKKDPFTAIAERMIWAYAFGSE